MVARRTSSRALVREDTFRGSTAATVKQSILSESDLDITTKSIQQLSDVATMTPSDGERLTYDTVNGWQNEAAGLPLSGGTLTGALSVSNTTATISSGTGTPESVVTAPVGSLFLRTDGGAGTTLYVKESGAGNTGWISK